MFKVPDNVANQLAMSEMVKIECIANELAKSEHDEDSSMKINNQVLEQIDPTNHNALLNLIKNCELKIESNL